MPPTVKILVGLAATIASAWLFHGPAGYGERLLAGLEAQVRPLVARQDVESIGVSFERDPMSRNLQFRGAANDFQRQRFVELVQEANIRGVASVGWDPASPVSREAAR